MHDALKKTAETVAARLVKEKCETSNFAGNQAGSVQVEGWQVCGLAPTKEHFTVCQLLLSKDGDLYLRHATTPRRREDAKVIIEAMPVRKVEAMTRQSPVTLASRIDHLLTDMGLH